MAKPSRGPKRAQPSDSEYESRLRMSWIDEGGIDLRAARANLLEFVAGLYEDALKLLQEPEAAAAPEPRAARAARKAPLRKKKPPVRMKKKLQTPRQNKKRPPPRQKKKLPLPGQKKKVLPRRKTGGKKRK